MPLDEPIVIDYTPAPFRQRSKEILHRLPQHIRAYTISIFPIFQWIHRYHLSWLVQDVIAGITVGIVIVPQSMAYAKIANLDPQYGLYTSFVGASIYCFFGTSKDISIGPISTVSLLVGQSIAAVAQVHPEIDGNQVAVTLSLLAGMITIAVGLIRLGIFVDLIPEPAIAGYMTGSAITICVSQWPKLFGLSSKVSTHNPPYLIVGYFFANLKYTRWDAAFGIVSLLALYGIKFACTYSSRRFSKCQKLIFFFSIMRNGLVVLVGTLISYLINIGRKTSPFSVIQAVPAGFDAMGIPKLNPDIIREVGGTLPSIVIILILEHVSVAKSFGRIYDYAIDPSQETLAIGFSNVIGSFFGAYPATGAFSRTAIMARSGVKTPIAGVFSGAVVVLALYALTPAFYYIPEAVLSAVVIHAVSGLVSGPKYLKELWTASPMEFLIWVSAVMVTVFVDVETGIYVAVALSFALLLYKLARPPVRMLARLPITFSQDPPHPSEKKASMDDIMQKHYIYVDENDANFPKWLQPLPPGILVMRPGDSMLYPNAAHISEKMVAEAKARTRCGNLVEMSKKDSEKPWNHVTKSDNGKELAKDTELPILEAVVLDFSAVGRLDSTGLQELVTVRNVLDRYAGHTVEWHFTNLQSKQVRCKLVQFGFGSLQVTTPSGFGAMSSTSSSLSSDQDPAVPHGHPHHKNHDVDDRSIQLPRDRYPCFHWDIDTAVNSICQRWKGDPSFSFADVDAV
ncbi:sulfate transporter family-domain-containing protein [Radiomyces spectabilis]|uniref:sulfate transporter family-domain-containing protein n=1 Tax=Radiomyces spectabilis TaxID=64574 RepID=UPI002220C7F1|nr:sulfate transporter family-domain-containing protein [Radiomyces spectabilis]KAI8384843.1 sulfate transporter family-domain-containing protein [Radiomyces spectabilis]